MRRDSRRNRYILPLAALSILSGALAQADAATITFTGEDFGNVNQLSTAGTLVEAANVGSTSSITTTNGITFVGGATAATSSPSLAFQTESSGNISNLYDATTHKTGYTSITGLSDGDANALLDTFQFGSGTNHNLLTWSGLTVGQEYLFQILAVNDRTGVGSGQTFTVANVSGSPVGPFDASKNAVQLITGTFVADAATQQFLMSWSSGNNAQLQAYQIRAIPAPAAFTSGLALLAGCGVVGRVRRRA